MQCVKEDSCILKYASEQLRHDREFILSVMKVNGRALQYVPHFRNDKEIVMQHGGSLQYASNELKSDKDVVMAAVKQVGWTLHYATNELKNDRDVVMSAVIQDGHALRYSSQKLKNDEKVVMTAVKNNPDSFYWASDLLRNNSDFILRCIGEVGAKLLGAKWDEESAVPRKWKNDFEFRAVKLDRECFEYASDPLKNDEAELKQAIS